MKKSLLLVLFVSLSLRIGYVFIFPQDKILAGDQIGYDAIACNLIIGNGFSIYPHVPTPIRPPVYPFFLGIIYFIFGHSYMIARVFQAILGFLTCLVLFFIAKEIYNEKIAKISAWLLAVYPVLIVYTGLLLSEALFTFLLAIFVLLFIRWLRTKNVLDFVESGFFLGLATLTRPVTILFPFIVLLTMLVVGKRNYFHWFIFLIVFVITLFPWSIRNYGLFGIVMPCSIGPGGGLFISGNMAGGLTVDESLKKRDELVSKYLSEQKLFIQKKFPDVECERIFKQEGIRLIRANFKNYLLLLAKRLPRFWLTSHSSIFGVDKPVLHYVSERNYFYILVRLSLLLLHSIFLLFAFVGIFFTREFWQKYLILIMFLIYFTGHIIFEFIPRYHLPVMPYLFVFTAAGVYKICEKVKSSIGSQDTKT